MFDSYKLEEREQVDRNRAALRARLRQIPDEMEKEVELIQKRYDVPQPRTFPMAITFLIPEKYAF